MNVQLAKTLYRWYHGKNGNFALIETWLDTAIRAIAAGNGAQVVSTSANGVSVSFSNGMTNAEWAATLSLALSYDDTPPVSKITGRLI